MAAAITMSQDVILMPTRSVACRNEETFLIQNLDARVKFDGGHFSDQILFRNVLHKWIQFWSTADPRSKCFNRQFCGTNYVGLDRLIQMESITHYHQGFKWFSSKATANEHSPDMSLIDVHFCEEVVTLKTQLVAAFAHQLIMGYHNTDSEAHLQKMLSQLSKCWATWEWTLQSSLF